MRSCCWRRPVHKSDFVQRGLQQAETDANANHGNGDKLDDNKNRDNHRHNSDNSNSGSNSSNAPHAYPVSPLQSIAYARIRARRPARVASSSANGMIAA